MSCGKVEYYNSSLERTTTKAEAPLIRTDRAFYNVTTTDDPNIRNLSMKGEGTVFATDAIIAHLMCATKSVTPWDLSIEKVGNQMFIDKREGSPVFGTSF
jgi:translation initiation factor 3 subunit D